MEILFRSVSEKCTLLVRLVLIRHALLEVHEAREEDHHQKQMLVAEVT